MCKPPLLKSFKVTLRWFFFRNSGSTFNASLCASDDNQLMLSVWNEITEETRYSHFYLFQFKDNTNVT